jgi:hypothetical protein
MKNMKNNGLIRIGSEMVGRMRTFLRYSISSFPEGSREKKKKKSENPA